MLVKDNPGNAQPLRPKSLISITGATAKRIGDGDLREGLSAALCDVLNLVQSKLTPYLPARLQCPCCGYEGYSFFHLSNRLRIAWNSACPNCGSRSRHRGLAVLLPDLVNSNPALRKVLHFAPEPVLESALRKQDIEYRTSDLYLQDVDLPGEDLQHLSLPSRSYDLVLCNHVLEHVADDDKAVSEIARILKPSGIAVITIPGDWTRSHTVVFPDQRLNGHYRDYGMDAKKLFLRHFANVRVVDMHVFDRLSRRRRRAIRRHDLVFICQTSM